MLARRGYRDITVLERLSEPPPPASDKWGNPERSYNLGIGGRGQTSLAKLGAADRVMSWCAEAVVSFACTLVGEIKNSRTIAVVCPKAAHVCAILGQAEHAFAGLDRGESELETRVVSTKGKQSVRVAPPCSGVV